MAKQQTPKEAIVIARYSLKRNGKLTGAVIYRVRSSQPCKAGRVDGTDQVERDGQWYNVYKVSCFAEKTTGCTCPSRCQCYHRTQLDIVEQNYAATRTMKVVAPEKVETSALAKTRKVAKVAQPVVDPAAQQAKLDKQKIELAALNGAKQSAAFFAELPSRQKQIA